MLIMLLLFFLAVECGAEKECSRKGEGLKVWWMG